MAQKPLFIIARIVDYRFQALAADEPSDPLAGFEDMGAATLVSSEREEMFQAARKHGGLLLNASGVPSPRGMAAFQAKLRLAAESLNAAMADGVDTTGADPEDPDTWPKDVKGQLCKSVNETDVALYVRCLKYQAARDKQGKSVDAVIAKQAETLKAKAIAAGTMNEDDEIPF